MIIGMPAESKAVSKIPATIVTFAELALALMRVIAWAYLDSVLHSLHEQ